MDKPFSAYVGDEPYIFVSYAHADTEIVYPEIAWLHDQGFNVWYDEGISPGSEWRDELANAIGGASLFVFFTTPQSVERPHCLREVNFAIDRELPLLAVHLAETVLPDGLQLSLGSTQAILKYTEVERDYRRKLIRLAGDHLVRGIAVSVAPRATAPTQWKTLAGFGAVLVALCFVAFWAGRANVGDDRSPPPLVVSYFDVPISDQCSTNSSIPLLSDDGRHYVHFSKKGARISAIARSLAEPDERHVDLGESEPFSPFLSPDGEWLGFHDLRDGHWKKVRLSGGSPVTIAPTGLRPQIVANSGVTWGSRGEIVFANQAFSGLVRMAQSGGSVTQFTHAGEGEEHVDPRFLPDGKRVLHRIVHVNGNSTIALTNLDTGETVEFGFDGFSATTVGDFLVFLREASAWAARFDHRQGRVISQPVPLLPMADATWALSATSGHAMVGRAAADPRVIPVWVDALGHETALQVQPGYYSYPRVSPVGRQLAMVHHGEAGADMPSIWVTDLDSRRSRRLTNPGDLSDHLPVWSPSADAIAFVRGERGGGDIFQVTAAGGPATLLFETDRDVKPTDWLTTGQILFDYWHGTAGMDFGVFNTTDGSHELLVSGDAYEARGVVSPDQQWLAYQSSESGRNEILVRSFQNLGASKQVSLTGGEQPRWSPDGLQLYFRNGCDFFAVAMSDIADGPLPSPTPIFEDRNYLTSVVGHDYDVAPDGRFVFLKPLAGESTAVYVQNFVAQLEELVPSVN